ncbi:hypothetical protein AcV5_005902 [Taiwanofungus camphoratus]|nr:hypothetical protein AcV5_005902 [Antrodia cinnamomea]
MSVPENVAIFWDYENCALPSNTVGYAIVNNVREIALRYGSVNTFKAYSEQPEQSTSKSTALRSELQSCGVSLIDCPHNGRKDAVDKMMLVDMMAYAIDNPAPATIILISGDRDFVYAVSILCLRRYRLVLLAPSVAHGSLKAQASVVYAWPGDVLSEPKLNPSAIASSVDDGENLPSRNEQGPTQSRQDPQLSITSIPASPPPSPTVTRRAPTVTPSAYAPGHRSPTSDSTRLPTPLGTPSTASDSTAVDYETEADHDTPAITTGDFIFTTPQRPSSSRLNTDAEPFLSALESTHQREISFTFGSYRSGSRPREGSVPPRFEPLVKVLRQQLLEGNIHVGFSQLGSLLLRESPSVYERAGVTRLKEYAALAQEAGIVLHEEDEEGTIDIEGNRWVKLHPRYHKEPAVSSNVQFVGDWDTYSGVDHWV